ncbi:MAG TPA: NHL repeat-containing protein [Terriglobales bacterium]|nr:NHL repeat-containing protein [Terriglobales bacterium]
MKFRACFSLGLVSLILSIAASMPAQVVTTTAGGYVGDGGSALNAGFTYPAFAIQDSSGNVYISDHFAHRIRKVTMPARTISTFAGTGISGFGGDGGLAQFATLSYPRGMVFDASGNLLFVDGNNNRIRKIDSSGIISTIVGNGFAGYSGDNGPALLASLNSPYGLTLDSAGNMFFTDLGNAAVRKVDTSGIITTVAGNGIAGYSGDGGPAIFAMLSDPRGLSLDFRGNLYIADTSNHAVRIVDTNGIINTYAGNGTQGFSGDGGPATLAKVGNPRDVLALRTELLISNGGLAHVREVDFASQIINSFAGLTLGFNGDGPLLATDFFQPTGMFLANNGNLLLVDTVNERIRQLSHTVTATLAGGRVGDGGRATQASFQDIENIAFDSAGNYYVVDFGGNRIRKVDTAGNISTVAGNGFSGYSGDGGPATQAMINLPYGVAADASGNIFISDTSNGVIRKVDTTGTITTFATNPNFSDLVSMAIDSGGNLYVADDSVCVIWKITPTGVSSVFVGVLNNCGYNGDGIRANTAYLNVPYGVAIDSKGNLYIGDTGNNRVRKVTRSGLITTIAGNGTCGFSGDGGLGTLAMICTPEGVAVDAVGNAYFGDYSNFRVRKITPAGIITTVAGSGNGGYNGENLPAASTNMDGPISVGIGSDGNVYYLDDAQNRVRRVH